MMRGLWSLLRSRKVTRSVCICNVCVLIILAAFIMGYANPVWTRRASLVAGLTDGRIEIAWSNCPIKRVRDAWDVSRDGAAVRVKFAPSRSWLPSKSSVTPRTITAAGTAVIPLTCFRVPLLPWFLAAIIASGLLWWRAPRRFETAMCQKCGYDLSGLADQRCPECGESVISRVQRVVAGVLRGARCHC